jgi:iron complex outermembrane receptor protein
VKDIQIQRGVGNSLHGAASFGGAVNIVSAGLEQDRSITITTGFGGFWHDGEWIGEMEKQSIEYNSGLIGGRWNLAARYSRQLSDGYRKDAWYDGWSYYISASRLDHNMTTTVNAYGGPMQMHLAYYGVSRDIIENDRRFNPLTYNNETDNFNQPHYELHNSYRLNDNLTLQNTLFHIHGNGYYEQLKEKRNFASYNIPPVTLVSGADTVATFDNGDLVRQQWVEKNQWGWNPRLDIKHGNGDAAVGGSFYYFESEHWGQVVWAEHVTSEISPRHRYYEYFGEKFYLSLYATERYQLNRRLQLSGGLQFRHQTYDFDQTDIGAFGGNDYYLDWTYLSPRIGLTYALTDRLSLLASYSLSFRTPTDVEVYEANDPNATPALDIEMERVHDIELGGSYQGERFSGSANLFYMAFENEIVPYGGITDYGTLCTTNADRSVHAGIELAATVRMLTNLELSGNFSYNYNRYLDFSVAEELYSDPKNWTLLGYETADYDENTIPGFPDYIGNLIAEYRLDRFSIAYRARMIGRQYVESGNRENLSIDPYFLSSVSAEIGLGSFADLGALSFELAVDNIFSEKYLSSGYGGVVRMQDADDLYWAEYYPAAERSIFSSLKLELR